ncbi:Retrotransposable element Tf2 155 kDa protein type 1 [Rhizoctonia solani AG-1 IB]|uniref:RNA-directed DNA polymerase n=1 Tax=Thanatephorus cucumeris (strain AG1-IB / isolate 7/3/14) TaxID=1108050 RepID=M5CDU2_THACB|nr:Retrotransposable element Tf2 155 kDa protein type 1 [Rhizoctonia solani AG-1 IB]
MGRALSVPLQSTFRSLSQTPGPAQPKSKIPAPEKYDSKKGPAAKSFILDCKTYFFSNSSSFPSDQSHISFVLMNLKEGQPKKWGQIYLEKLLDGAYEPILESWDAFEAPFLRNCVTTEERTRLRMPWESEITLKGGNGTRSDDGPDGTQLSKIEAVGTELMTNWSDLAAAQVAEHRLCDLKQSRAASDYATDFRIIASELEWLDAVLIAAFRQGLEAEVRSKLIEFTLHKKITTLDEFISTVCLIDDTLFEARRELRKDSNPSTSAPRPAQGRYGDFVSRSVQEQRCKAGECTKGGEKLHKWEECKNGWHLKSSERLKPAEVEELSPVLRVRKSLRETCSVSGSPQIPLMSIEPLFCAALQSNKSPLFNIDIEGITESQQALIDSGSSTNFIDPQFACSHNIPLIELDSPRVVIGIHGKQVQDSIRFKCRLVFNAQGRCFSAVFYLLPLGNCNLILGTPWHILANPDINWRTLEVLLCPSVEPRVLDIAALTTSIPEEFKAFQKVFSNNFFTTLPAHCSYDCAIPLEDEKDVPYGPIYPMTLSETAALKEHIDSELAAGKICPNTSPAGAPVMFVKRADGRLRSVVDYRRLNAITIKDRYALPRQDELIEKLRHAKIFTKLDLRNGYSNIRIKEGDEWKAAFRTKYGHLFQRFMNDIFRDLLDITVILFLDDIPIFSNSREEHVQHVTEVLSCLQKHNLFCNPSKCVFFVTEVTYIGLVVTPGGISMEQEKVKAIQEWPEPKNVKQVQSFLGFANFYCHFVHDFSRLACPLTSLTQKDQPWVWEAPQKEAFQQIKIAISKEPVLAHPDKSQPYTLETDASGAAMGAVLSQRKDDGCLHPVAFMSASFSPAELNYDTHDKELLAIICAFEHWRIFLEGPEHPVTVLTDHKNLEYWKSARTFNRRHARWHLILASYNFVIAYRPGKQSQKPDALSRRADHNGIEPSPQIMLPETQFAGFGAEISTLLLKQIKEALQDDPSLGTVITAAADPDSMLHSVAAKLKDYTLQDSLLLYQGRIVVPDEPKIKQKLLSHFHDSLGSGHHGRGRTLELINCHYYWPAMKFQVNRYVESCETCQ